MAIQIGLCSKILQDYDLAEAIQIAAAIGYQGMEIFGTAKHLPVDVKDDKVQATARLLGDAGMEAVTLCTYVGRFAERSDEECQQEIEAFKRYMDIADTLGCDLIRVIPGGPNDPTEARDDHWYRCAHYISQCCDLALGHAIGVVIENNWGLAATVDSTLELIYLVDRPNLGINYDPGNLYRMGKYYAVEALERLGDLVWNVQVKDADKRTGEDIWQLLLGEGDVDYESIVGWLQESEYEGYLSAECHREPDEQMSAVDIARHEYDALRSLLT